MPAIFLIHGSDKSANSLISRQITWIYIITLAVCLAVTGKVSAARLVEDVESFQKADAMSVRLCVKSMRVSAMLK